MDSIFRRVPAPRPKTAEELIAPEVGHLKKKGVTARDGKYKSRVTSWIFTIAICALLALYFMDPFLYALHKTEAIRAYLYLHSSGAEASAQELAASGIFTDNEIAALNKRDGSFVDYFSSTTDAELSADAVVRYMSSMRSVRVGPYETLDPIGKLRYLLFTRSGLEPPITWTGLSPEID